MKKLLVLGGAFQHIKVVEVAKELGIKTYVTDYLEHSPAKEIADVSLHFDVKDIDAIVEYCKKEKINGVINTSLDPCQIPYQQICERLNLPCYGTKEHFFKLTNKAAFKQMCIEHGVDVIPSYTEDDLTDEQIRNVEFPILIKPVDSRGSRGQTICFKPEDIIDAVKLAESESSNGQIIIEKYMGRNQDFAVAYIFIEGEGYLVRTADRFLGSECEKMHNVCIASASPSNFTGVYLKNVNSRVIQMFKDIGIKNGPVFMQGFIDGDTVRFYDPGFRFSGGEYEQLFKRATGIDLIAELVNFAITGKMNKLKIKKDLCYLNGMKIMQLCPTVKPGIVAQIDGEEKIKVMEDVVTFSKRYSVGETIPDANNVSRRFAEICTLSLEKKSELNVLQTIQNELKVFDENGINLICDKLDLSVL